MRAIGFLEGPAQTGPPQVFVTVGYAWHVPAAASDIRLMTATFDMGELTLLLEDLDNLARAVRVELATGPLPRA